MSKILAGTNVITMDEPCLLLSEQNLQSPDSRGFHRYQILLVMRGDRPAEIRIDLGLSTDFTAPPLRIPGGAKDDATGRFYVEHTVGELIDIANHIRAGLGTRPDTEPRLNLIENYRKEIDARQGRAVGRASFGYGTFRRVD